MKNSFIQAGSVAGQSNKPSSPVRRGSLWANLLLLNLITNSEAAIVSVDPGHAGTTTSYIQDFFILNSLNGAVLDGQTHSFDIFFTNNEFIVAAGFTDFTVDFFINQSGALGTWPTNTCSVTGYLMDAAGNPLGAPVNFPDYGSLPAQIWSGWPFYLPEGTQYLPATKMYESKFSGPRIYGNPNGYYIKPLIFGGIHFDVSCPDSPGNTIIGGRIVIANFNGSICVSPNPVPSYLKYFVQIPNPRLALTGLGSPGSPGGGSNAFNLRLTGTPNYPYILLSAPSLTRPVNWQPFLTNSADSNGNWNITFTNVGNASCGFFQAVAWPWTTPQ